MPPRFARSRRQASAYPGSERQCRRAQILASPRVGGSPWPPLHWGRPLGLRRFLLISATHRNLLIEHVGSLRCPFAVTGYGHVSPGGFLERRFTLCLVRSAERLLHCATRVALVSSTRSL